MRWPEHVVSMGQMRYSYSIFVGEPEGKRPLRRLRHSWKDHIRIDIRETGWEGTDWIHLIRDRDQ
jgi:hypothetical protein